MSWAGGVEAGVGVAVVLFVAYGAAEGLLQLTEREEGVVANYIDALARRIAEETGDAHLTPDALALYRTYALLCLAVGEATTTEMVHDAWSAWQAARRPRHWSIIPFGELSPEVRAMNEPYRDAIRAVAAKRATEGSTKGVPT